MQATQGGRLLVAPEQWEERERPSEAAGGTRGDAIGAPETRNTLEMVSVLFVKCCYDSHGSWSENTQK